MEKYKTVRLGDVTKIQFGYAFKSDEFISKEAPVIRIGDITENGIKPDYTCCYTNDFWNSHPEYRVQKNAILIAMSGATVGKACINTLDERLLLNQRVAAINVDEDNDKSYIFHAIKSEKFKKYVEKASIGCAQPNISGKQISDFLIPFMPITNQKYIAAVLNKCTELIKKYKQMLEKYDTLIKSRFIEMFGDITIGKYKFNTRKLGSVAEVGSSHRVFTTEFVEKGIPFYRGTEIGMLANGQQPEKPFYISESHYKRLTEQDSKPKIGDLLMPSICNKGQVWMVDTEKPFYYKDGRVLSISPNHEIYNSKYLQYFMREKTLIEYPKLGSGSTFAEFKIFLLKDIDVLTPPLSLQNDFASFVKQIDKSKLAVQKSLEKAETLYKSLMQEYFG